jgi:CheY-like chemotaxis protein
MVMASSNNLSEIKRNQPLDGLQILLVEDEADEAEIFTVMLESVGAEVIRVSYAYQALELLNHLTPSVLLCDVRLPDSTGDRLIQQIRSQETASQHLPAIATTVFMRETSGEKMLEAGFDRYLTKTYDPEELVGMILSLVND